MTSCSTVFGTGVQMANLKKLFDNGHFDDLLLTIHCWASKVTFEDFSEALLVNMNLQLEYVSSKVRIPIQCWSDAGLVLTNLLAEDFVHGFHCKLPGQIFPPFFHE